MAFYTDKADKKDSEISKILPGTYQGVCRGVYDLYWHKDSYQGKEELKHKAVIVFEVQAELKGIGSKTVELSKWYSSINLSTNPKYKSGLQKDIEAWGNFQFTQERIDKKFDLEALYGHNAFLNVQKTDNGKIRIHSISPIPETLEKIKPSKALEDIPPFVEKVREKAVSKDDHNDHNNYDGEGFDG